MNTERDELQAGISRRRFMRNAGVTAAGIAVAAAGTEAFLTERANPATARVPLAGMNPRALLRGEPLQGDILVGNIVSPGSQGLVVTPPASSPVTVSLTPNAHVWKAGDAALSAYNAGEEVILVGERRGNRFTAVSVADVSRTKVATINSRTGRQLHTNQGPVVITPHTIAQGVSSCGGALGGGPFEPVPLDDLKAGDEILVRGHLNRRWGMTATIIGARPKRDSDSLGL